MKTAWRNYSKKETIENAYSIEKLKYYNLILQVQ